MTNQEYKKKAMEWKRENPNVKRIPTKPSTLSEIFNELEANYRMLQLEALREALLTKKALLAKKAIGPGGKVLDSRANKSTETVESCFGPQASR